MADFAYNIEARRKSILKEGRVTFPLLSGLMHLRGLKGECTAYSSLKCILKKNILRVINHKMFIHGIRCNSLLIVYSL